VGVVDIEEWRIEFTSNREEMNQAIGKFVFMLN